MLKIMFILKAGKVKANGDAPIYAKVSIDNQSITLSTGKGIPVERWELTNKLRNPLKQEKEKVLKKSLDLFEMNITKKYHELLAIDQAVDLSVLKDQITGLEKQQKMILDIFERHNTDFERMVNHKERAAASLQKY